MNFTLERDGDQIIFADSIGATYGVGTTAREAVEDYLISANELVDLLGPEKLSHQMQKRYEHLLEVRSLNTHDEP